MRNRGERERKRIGGRGVVRFDPSTGALTAPAVGTAKIRVSVHAVATERAITVAEGTADPSGPETAVMLVPLAKGN